MHSCRSFQLLYTMPKDGGGPFVVSAGDDGFTTAPPVMMSACMGTPKHGIAPHQVKPSYDKHPSRLVRKKTGPHLTYMGHKSEFLSVWSYFTSASAVFVSQP